jgi:hypothetical protein
VGVLSEPRRTQAIDAYASFVQDVNNAYVSAARTLLS